MLHFMSFAVGMILAGICGFVTIVMAGTKIADLESENLLLRLRLAEIADDIPARGKNGRFVSKTALR